MLDIATTRTFLAQPKIPTEIRPWIWPLPKIDDFRPSIISRLRVDSHSYVDVGYDAGEPALRFVPVFAAQDGVITYAGKVTSGAGKTTTRYSMCLDHAGGWSTRYGELEHMFAMPTDRFARRRKTRVRAGDVLGYASRSPVHVRFELWRSNEDGYSAVEPGQHMHNWLMLRCANQPTTHAEPARIAA